MDSPIQVTSGNVVAKIQVAGILNCHPVQWRAAAPTEAHHSNIGAAVVMCQSEEGIGTVAVTDDGNLRWFAIAEAATGNA